MSPEEFLKLFEDQAVRYGQASAEIREASGATRFVADEVKACNEIRLKGSTFPQMEDTLPLTGQDFSLVGPEEPKNQLEGQEARNRHNAKSQDARTALAKEKASAKAKGSGHINGLG